MNSRTLKVTLPAGVAVTVYASGNYYRVIEAPETLKVAIGSSELETRPEGTGQAVPAGFDRLTLYSAVEQTVQVAINDGRIDDNRLAVNTPSGGSYVVSSLEVAEVVSPANNANGLLVFGLGVITSPGTLRLMMKKTAPTVFDDTGALSLIITTSTGVPRGVFTMPIKVPAGWGLYLGDAMASFKAVQITYRVL